MDRLFKILLHIAGLVVFILVTCIFIYLIKNSILSIQTFGLQFISGKEWDPVSERFGALPFLVGTILTSGISLLISLPFALSLALFIGEYKKEGVLVSILSYATDLLAGIPSVIYGLWGLSFLAPLIRKIEIALEIPPYGVGIMTASLVLAIMIIPYLSSIASEVIKMVPQDIKEAGLALGATRFDLVRRVILPYARSGILAGILLAFGRAFGETMAVTMVIGNYNGLPESIFSPANTMASVIANEFTEAVKDIHLSALIEIGLLLFIITFIINYIGNMVIEKLQVKRELADEMENS